MGKQRQWIAIGRGLLGILIINCLFALLCALFHSLSVLFIVLLSAIGFAQFLYVIPLLVAFNYAERWNMMKGVWIGVGITALVNAAYYLFWLWKR
jgi:hypothetical protein